MSQSPPEPLRNADADLLATVDRLYFDIDDTLTWRGQLPEVAARSMYAASAAGLSLVAVTGRSFAWAELFVRLFPVDAVVAETGAVALFRTRRHNRDGVSGANTAVHAKIELLHHEADAEVRRRANLTREKAAARVLAQVPTARLALDNPGRLYDTAYDLIEDGPFVSDTDAARIRALLHEDGLTTAQSSVHINAWKVGPSGPFDKATMVDRLLQTRFSSSLNNASATLAYVGDSKNDGAMFARAGVSIGVKNVHPHLDWLAQRNEAPRFLVDGAGGYGFAEAVSLLLDARAD